MQLTNKNILLISPVKWNTQFVSKHHYAKELSLRKNSVYYLNPPSSIESKTTISKYLHVIDYKLMMRGAYKLPRLIVSFLTKIEIEKIGKKHTISFDIIWNFDSSRFFNLSRIYNKLKIAHLMDLTESFNRNTLCESSNICFGVSDEIVKEMEIYNLNTFRINHGLSTVIDTNYKIKDINKNLKIKVGYIGNLTSKYIDWKIIYQLTEENKETEFYFLGEDFHENNFANEFKNKTQNQHNSFFLGTKKSNLIPLYLNIFDINLICYRNKDYPKQITNSHKILEYLYSGHVIISNYMSDYDNNSNLIEMVDDINLIPSKFKDVLNNLETYNSKENINYRINFALENTYSKQVERIMSIINTHYK